MRHLVFERNFDKNPKPFDLPSSGWPELEDSDRMFVTGAVSNLDSFEPLGPRKFIYSTSTRSPWIRFKVWLRTGSWPRYKAPDD